MAYCLTWQNLKNRMARKVEVKESFTKQMEEMISKGILREVGETYPKRYLPLLAVIVLDIELTKVRVCLDAKGKYQLLSTNDALLTGKIEIPNVLVILTKFRCDDVALIGDIRKMYWQINLYEDDQKYHCVVWEEKHTASPRCVLGRSEVHQSPRKVRSRFLKIEKVHMLNLRRHCCTKDT